MKVSTGGFTLIELMVVVAVMGILISIIIPNLTRVQASARDAQRKADLTSYRLALDRYFAHVGSYPIGTGGSFKDVLSPIPTGIFNDAGPLTTNNFLPGVLKDPVPGSPTYFYRYISDDHGGTYVIYAKMEAGNSSWWQIKSSGDAGGVDDEPPGP